jgi:CO/xanthine dehydrogenase FAD-binding subunit
MAEVKHKVAGEKQFAQVFYPETLQALFMDWAKFPASRLIAGGVLLSRASGEEKLLALPPSIISLNRLDELSHINRTEQYIEFGACVRLSEIIELGNPAPEVLRLALATIGNPPLRNLSTLGGNIAGSVSAYAGGVPLFPRTAAAPLCALDARIEIRSGTQAPRWISATRFFSGGASLMDRELVSRIRIPLELWNYSAYRRFPAEVYTASDTPDPAECPSVVLIARTQKNTLADLQVAVSAGAIYRDPEITAALTGRTLPLDHSDALSFTGNWRALLDKCSSLRPLTRERLAKALYEAILPLCE